MGRWGFFVGVWASGTEIGDVNIGGFGSVWSGNWGRVQGFVNRYEGVLGQTSEMLILQGVRGLGPEIGNVNIWEGGLGDIDYGFIFWEWWFRSGGLGTDIGEWGC